MKVSPSTTTRRSGAIVPLVAFLMIPLVAMVAFAVDLGYLVQVKTELQNVADAAALAGAQQLMEPYARWIIPSTNKSFIRSAAIKAAKDAAKEVAAANYAGNTAIELNDDDIEVGFMDKLGVYTDSPLATQFPNTVKLRARRDSKANKPVSLFFAPAIGASSVELDNTARATIYTGNIDSFNTAPSGTLHVLPLAYDSKQWDYAMLTGFDGFGGTSKDANGDPTIKIYNSAKPTGSLGELALDDSKKSSGQISDWISSGLPTDDVKTLLDSKLLPLSSHAANTWDWAGNFGLQSGTAGAVNKNTGEAVYMPLFQPKKSTLLTYKPGDGEGDSYKYDITRLVPVKIMPPSDTDKEIVVQPSAFIEPAALFDLKTVKPAGSTTSTSTSFTTPKLTE